MSLLLKRLIPGATKLVPNSDQSDYGYGPSGVVKPGNIKLVNGIGPYRPEHGCIWLQDDSHAYWEVSEDALQRAI